MDSGVGNRCPDCWFGVYSRKSVALNPTNCKPRRRKQCTLESQSSRGVPRLQVFLLKPSGTEGANWVKELNQDVCVCVCVGMISWMCVHVSMHVMCFCVYKILGPRARPVLLKRCVRNAKDRFELVLSAAEIPSALPALEGSPLPVCWILCFIFTATVPCI